MVKFFMWVETSKKALENPLKVSQSGGEK